MKIGKQEAWGYLTVLIKVYCLKKGFHTLDLAIATFIDMHFSYAFFRVFFIYFLRSPVQYLVKPFSNSCLSCGVNVFKAQQLMKPRIYLHLCFQVLSGKLQTSTGIYSTMKMEIHPRCATKAQLLLAIMASMGVISVTLHGRLSKVPFRLWQR